ncbi:hypothetical protein NP493_1137g00029 [Ridgeia piscesae]|uniref:Uncharacterized protein n=1 Tax=Ridgeia piscesae TaxID=27915 RepID=A0AAD9KGK1_RIDPI|nr:hypothetical protein NP493_1137g00029 [Ridgeia piscesae]
MLTRKRKVQNLEDVVKRMNELDLAVDVIPCFVARDLGNLPPITFGSLDVSVLLTKIESLNDEVLLMRGAMKCQQTTPEALTKVCSETISRVHKLESEMLGVRSPGCPDVNMKVTASCQRRKAQGKPVVCPTKVTVTLPLVEPHVTRNVDSAVNPGPVETDSETDSQCRWSTVVKKTSKRTSNLCAEQSSPVVSVKKARKPVIGSAKVASITAVVKRKRKANVFATRFPPDQSADDLKRYLDGKLNVSVTCSQLKSKYPEYYRSFYVSAEVDDPKVFLDGHIWPEGIFVRWYKPSEKTHCSNTRKTDSMDDDSNGDT